MTVSTTHNEISYTASGGDTFAYTFLIAQASDLLVYVDDVVQALGYSVTQVGDPAGGNVVFAVAPEVGATVRLLRSTEITQEVNLLEGSRLPADQVEGMWDKLTLICQDLDGRVDAVETDITDITIGAVNLVESTRAGLPTPGVSGLLRHVTDDVRGVWMDTGSQWMPLNQHVLDVRAFGALCDDTTDDTAAIQAAIDVAGDTSVISRTGVEVLIPGPCVITSTLLMQRKSITLRGLGFGSRGAAYPNCYLRWDGAAGVPMIRVQDTRGGARIANLRLIGNSTAKPDSAISLYETDDGVPNICNVIEHIHIGYRLGEDDAVNQFTNGIRVEGAAALNNDEMILRNIHIQGCDEAGIRIGCSQNVAIQLERVSIAECLYGIHNAGHLVATGVVFANSTGADFYVPALDDFGGVVLAQFHITEYIGEHSARMAQLDGGAIFSIRGGYYQVDASLNADGKVIHAETNNYHHIVLRELRLTIGTGSPATAAFLSVTTPPANAGAKHIVLDGVRGWSQFMIGGPNANGLDAHTSASTDIRTVHFREAAHSATTLPTHQAQNVLGGASGLQWDPKRWDVPYSLALLGATPAQITADQNDYDPSRASVWRLSSDAARTITGIAGGSNGRLLYLANVGAQTLVLANQHANSAVANRLITGTGASLTVLPDETILLIYDATTARWRMHHRLLSSAILTDPVVSGTVTGTYTLSNPTLSGTITGTPTWASGQTFPSVKVGAADVVLERDAANVLALKNGVATPQTIRLYNTDDGANDEYLSISWAATANAAVLRNIAAGTGTARALRVHTATDNSTAIYVNTTIDNGVILGGSTATTATPNGRVNVGGANTTSATSGTSIGLRVQESFSPTATSTMVAQPVRISPTINYSNGTPGAGSYEAVRISVTETALPTGTNYLIRATTGAAGTTEAFAVLRDGGVRSYGATAGIGYGTGAGGVVTQATSKATGVTLDKASGQITLHNATLNAGTSVGFTLTNAAIATTDVVVVSIDAGATADSYFVGVDAVGAGSCRIHLRNVSAGNLGEAVVLNFVVIKGVAA